MEIVKLIGSDVLPESQKATLEIAKIIRQGFLQQNAFMDVDSYSSYDRQEKILGLILDYDRLCREAIAAGAEVEALFAIPSREEIGRAKSVPEAEYAAAYEALAQQMRREIDAVTAKGGEEE